MLTNLTAFTNLADLTNVTYLIDLTYITNLIDLTNLNNLTMLASPCRVPSWQNGIVVGMRWGHVGPNW